MEAQESMVLKDLKQPYKKVNENLINNKTASNDKVHGCVRKSTLYWLMGLTVVIVVVLLVINGIIVYYTIYLQQPNDDVQIPDQTTSQTIVTTSQDVTTTATKTSSAGIPVTTSQDVTTTATKTSPTGIPVTTSQDVTTAAIRTASTARPDCPRDWMLTHGSSCYNISGDIQSWNKASDKCLGLGGYLAEINDAAENKFLVTEIKLLEYERYWIGLTDEIEEGSWVWSYSNTTLTPEMYSNWHHNQPDNGSGNENCVELTEELPESWNDDQCANKHYYICERDLR